MALYLLKPSELPTAWLFTGKKRSGKSYHAVQIIDKWTRQGGHVLTNLVINLPKFPRRRGQVKYLPTCRDVIKAVVDVRAELSGHILVVLDEAANEFDSRNFKNFPTDLRAWLQQNSKMSMSLITITHQHDLVDTTFRKLADYVVDHVLVQRSGGFAGTLAGIFCPGLMYRETFVMAAGEPHGKPYEKKIFWGKQKIFAMYDTFQLVEGSFAGRTELQQAAFRSGKGRRLLVFVALCYIGFRFTPLGKPPLKPSERVLPPFASLSGQVVYVPTDKPVTSSTLCDFVTSSGEMFQIRPLHKWGMAPEDIIGQYATIDVPATYTLLGYPEFLERVENAKKYKQKK